MSRLAELVRELCPRGVPYKALGEIGHWYGGSTPSKSEPEYWTNGTVPWLSPKDMTGEIVDSTEDRVAEVALKRGPIKLVPAGSIAIVVRSNILRRRLPTAYVPISVTLNQDMRAVVPYSDVLPQYLAHVLHQQAATILTIAGRMAGSMAAVESQSLLGHRIPVPPVEVQREIVRLLDMLQLTEAELERKLQAESVARQRQYAFYRERILTVRDGRRWIPMSEFGTFIRGRRFTKDDLVPAGIPSIHYGEIYTYYGTSATETLSHVRDDLAGQLRYARPGDVVIAGVGETVEDVAKAVAWLGDTEVAIHDDSFAFRSDEDPTYIAYVMQTASFHAQKEKHVTRAKVKRVGGQSLGKIVVPVPSIEEQRRIVGILDKFDAIVKDLSIGLPAELAARRKQYEFYRDRLLTFEEAA